MVLGEISINVTLVLENTTIINGSFMKSVAVKGVSVGCTNMMLENRFWFLQQALSIGQRKAALCMLLRQRTILVL